MTTEGMSHYEGGGMKHNGGKLRLSLVPRDGTRVVARVMQKALEKYKEGSWVNVPIAEYREAVHRHLLDYLDDPTGLDQESGLPHYAHLAANVMIIAELEEKAKREVKK